MARAIRTMIEAPPQRGFCSNSAARGRGGRTWQEDVADRSLFMGFGRGGAPILSFRFPDRGGRRADNALCPAGDRAMSGVVRRELVVAYRRAPALGSPTPWATTQL